MEGLNSWVIALREEEFYGKHKVAAVDYSKAIELDRKNINAYYKRGEAKHKYGDYSGALEDYTTALRLEQEKDNIRNSSSEVHDNWRIDENQYVIEKEERYYESGQLRFISIGEYEYGNAMYYYESGELDRTRNIDGKYGLIEKGYYKNGVIKTIEITDLKYNDNIININWNIPDQQYKFKFDQMGNERVVFDSELTEKLILEKNKVRKYLKLTTPEPESENAAELHYNFITTKIGFNDEFEILTSGEQISNFFFRVEIHVSNEAVFKDQQYPYDEHKIGEFFTDSTNKYIGWEVLLRRGFKFTQDPFSFCETLEYRQMNFSNKELLKYLDESYNVNSKNIFLINDGVAKINRGEMRQFEYGNLNFEYDYHKVMDIFYLEPQELPYCYDVKGNSQDVYVIWADEYDDFGAVHCRDIIEVLFPGKYITETGRPHDFEEVTG